MGLKQEFEKAYKKWEAEEKKLGETKENYKKLYLGMESLKKDLCSFANRFEKNFIQAEKMTDKMANNIYNDIRDNLVGKIVKAKNFIDLNKLEKDIVAKHSLKYRYAIYDSMISEFNNSENIADFCSHQKNLCSFKFKTDNNVVKSIQYVFNFVSSIFGAFENEIRIAEKITVDDKEYFYDENDSNFISKAIRYFYPDDWSRKAQKKYGKHTIEPVDGDIKIFPQGKPLPSEVKQAGVGDCYLMAALVSLAKHNPKAIENCFVQGLDKIENKKNIDIRFFYLKDYKFMVPIIITVNRKKVIMPRYIKDGALWPKLIEKAYAVYRKKGLSDTLVVDVSTEKKSDAGRPEIVLSAITGEFADVVSSENKFKFDKISSKLKKSKSLVCDFKKNFKIKDVKSGEEIQIYDHHAYAIVGIGEKKSKKYIRLIEPNKVVGRDPKYNKKSKEGGHIAMSQKDFEDNCCSMGQTINHT